MPGTRRILQPRKNRRYPSVFRRYISGKETFLHFGPKPLLFRKQIQLNRIYFSAIHYQSILLKPEDFYQVFLYDKKLSLIKAIKSGLPSSVELTTSSNGLSYFLLTIAVTNLRYSVCAIETFLPKYPKIKSLYSHSGSFF